MPTRGVRIEVKAELLWTRKVTTAPTSMAKYPVNHEKGPGKSALITFRTMPAIGPLRSELRAFTMKSSERTMARRAKITRIAPAGASPMYPGKPVPRNKYEPTW